MLNPLLYRLIKTLLRRVDIRKLLDSYRFGVAMNVMTSQRNGMKDLIDFKTSDAFIVLYSANNRQLLSVFASKRRS